MPPSPDIQNILGTLLLLGIELYILVFFLVLTGMSLRKLKNTWRWALLFGIIALALNLPSSLAGLIFLDVGRLAPDQPKNLWPVIKVGAGLFMVIFLAIMVPLRGLYFHVAFTEWSRVRQSAQEGLAGPRSTRLLGIGIGFGVGLVAIVVTYAVFYACNVHESAELRDLQRLFPGLDALPKWMIMSLGIGFVTCAAIVEEMIFRGGMLGFLLRITGNRTLLAWVFIAAVSFVWALLHLHNTDTPVIKIAQVFVLGLALGGMTRQWGIGSAISAHVTLNICAVFGTLIFPDM